MPNQRNRGRGRVAGERRVATLADAQAGAVSLDQLRESGISRRVAVYRTDLGRLHRLHRGVYAVGHRPRGRTGELRAALLACGDGALVSHGTAAGLWGLLDQSPRLIDITGGGQAGRKRDGIRCRRCRYPSEAEIAVHDGVTCTTPARTLVDLAGMLSTSSLRRAVERAAAIRRLDLPALDAALTSARGRRGIPALWAITDEWRSEDGLIPDVNGDFEAMVLPRLVALGLPRPACNVRLRLGDDRIKVDFLWRERRLVVETDGAQTHATPVAFQRDRKRDQILVAAGYRVARVTWTQIAEEAEAVAGRIAQGLATPP
jgi:hypothetical protein